MNKYIADNLLLIISFAFGLISSVYARAQDYTNAPACALDTDRNHSVLAAIQALDRAEDSPDYSFIKNEMQNAYLNLEQVMNYGAMQWSQCITCNPYLSIDGNPNHTYMNVAWRLINFSRRFYNNPNYNEYLGLAETMETNIRITPYCGAVANAIDVSTIMDEYEFGRLTPSETVLCGGPNNASQFILTDGKGDKGRILKSCHFNEGFYWYLNNEIIFLDANGYVTSILRGGPDYWEGPYKGQVSLRITHYISRDRNTDPCARPSWYGQTTAAEACYSGIFGWPGKNSWAKDGNKYWLINSTGYCEQYIIFTGNNFNIYDRCGNLLSKHIYQTSRINDFGHTQWEGYTEMPDGSRGRDWWLAWL